MSIIRRWLHKEASLRMDVSLAVVVVVVVVVAVVVVVVVIGF